jgi:ABC-type nitrate/sulfonate/bicarbonate transport system, permease component
MSDTGLTTAVLDTNDVGGQALARRRTTVSKRGSIRESLTRWALPTLSIVACLLVWHELASHHVDLGIVTFRNVPAPWAVAKAAVGTIGSGKFIIDLEASLLRVLLGFLAAALVGIGLGVAIGRYRLAASVLMPPLELLRPIPAVAWIPLAVLMFPSSEASMMSITFVGALFPIIISTIHGVESVNPRVVAAARSLGAPTRAILLEVLIPAAAPSIFAGLTIGMGTAWFCLVTAEMISGQFGIGYFTWESYTLQNYDDIIVGMMLIGVLGMASSALVRWTGRLLCPWTKGRTAR